jgi:hypothetical protein
MLALVLASGVVACARGEVRTYHGVPLAPNVHCSDADCRGYQVDPYVRSRSRYGIACMGNVPPGTIPNPDPPPESYAVADIGKPGFPTLSRDEFAMVRRIQRYVHSKTLRLAWLGSSAGAPRSSPGEFIVVDAADGPCEVAAAGYSVLNGECNEFYQPGENPYSTHPGSGCYDVPRPWMTAAPR